MSTTLYLAAADGDTNQVCELLKAGASSLSSDGFTALSAAAEGGHLATVKALLAHSQTLQSKQTAGGGENDHTNMDSVAVRERGDVNAVLPDGTTALLRAVQFPNNVRVLAQLLNAGANISYALPKTTERPREEGWTALHYAVRADRFQNVRYLVSRGANLNQPAADGETPLHRAANQRDVNLVRWLLLAGADPDLQTCGTAPKTPDRCAWSREMRDLFKSFRTSGLHAVAQHTFDFDSEEFDDEDLDPTFSTRVRSPLRSPSPSLDPHHAHTTTHTSSVAPRGSSQTQAHLDDSEDEAPSDNDSEDQDQEDQDQEDQDQDREHEQDAERLTDGVSEGGSSDESDDSTSGNSSHSGSEDSEDDSGLELGHHSASPHSQSNRRGEAEGGAGGGAGGGASRSSPSQQHQQLQQHRQEQLSHGSQPSHPQQREPLSAASQSRPAATRQTRETTASMSARSSLSSAARAGSADGRMTGSESYTQRATSSSYRYPVNVPTLPTHRRQTVNPSRMAEAQRRAPVRPPKWVPDEKCDACVICHDEFTLFTRRHHCRSCGRVVCAACSAREMPLPNLKIYKNVRVCSECFERFYSENEDLGVVNDSGCVVQ